MLSDTIVYAALGFRGMAFGSDPERTLRTLFPFDKRGLALGFLAGYPDAKPKPIPPMYTCGLTAWAALRQGGALGELRVLGGRDFLQEPYGLHLQLVNRRLVQLGQEHDLWVVPQPGGPLPEASDIAIIGAPGAQRTAFGGEEHVRIFTGDGESIDGGQDDAGNRGYGTACEEVHSRPVWRGRELWLDHVDGRRGRRVQGWLRAGQLPCR